MATSIASKEELACLPLLEGDSNYPLWARRMRTFMKNKDLWAAISADPGANPARALKKQLNDSASILAMKILDRLFVSIVNDENEDSGYLLWKKITERYARYTTVRFNKCTKDWQNVKYNGSMLNFLDDVECCLTNFASIGHPMSSRDICGNIIGKISESRRALTDLFVVYPELNNNHELLMDCLKDIAKEEDPVKRKAPPERTATALST
ncbi:hypothetical protein PTTG_27028 [Puccinia triticina 1-1 BBBD Race 1]|uniref:DUF4219 domain-containing protein n=1 Tax=Puccinia triticina (isolate 1-1 / race 1 (BBBD)) TaxID=630390 RepID=A0A180GP17_PUCT1|nr:hypothetical protein PTTG_27028 [Puccinia triticina 1-1 BBBD Race 1]